MINLGLQNIKKRIMINLGLTELPFGYREFLKMKGYQNLKKKNYFLVFSVLGQSKLLYFFNI